MDALQVRVLSCRLVAFHCAGTRARNSLGKLVPPRHRGYAAAIRAAFERAAPRKTLRFRALGGAAVGARARETRPRTTAVDCRWS